MIPLNEKLNGLSDEEVLFEFGSNSSSFKKYEFYPVFSLRIDRFKDILLKEASSEKNINLPFFNAIKMAWLPILAILEYSKSEVIKKELNSFIKAAWNNDDYENFLFFIKKDPCYQSYFI